MFGIEMNSKWTYKTKRSLSKGTCLPASIFGSKATKVQKHIIRLKVSQTYVAAGIAVAVLVDNPVRTALVVVAVGEGVPVFVGAPCAGAAGRGPRKRSDRPAPRCKMASLW